MMQSSTDWDKLLPSLLALGGVIIGSALTLVGNLLAKRQERKAQLHKIISEKRFNAYEEIIPIVRMATYGAGRMESGETIKFPVILQDVEAYDLWFQNLVSTYKRVAHLIDKRTAVKLVRLQNYLHNFESVALKVLRDSEGKILDQYVVEKIGMIVRYDFYELGSDVIESASQFYTSDIYNDKFVPSTFDKVDREQATDIFNLNLFQHEKEINSIIANAGR